MGTMELYEKFRSVPDEAKKKIQGGRLNGKTDINPMWRIKKLTEEFGPSGKGWYAPITERWTETGANGEITANIRINLYVKYGDEWGMPIEGVGGSLLITKESSGLRTDDDAFKKAYTDALSVACKALGIGADVYFEKDVTKYDEKDEDPNVKRIEQPRPKKAQKPDENKTDRESDEKKAFCSKFGISDYEKTISSYEKRLGNIPFNDWTEEEFLAVEEDIKAIQKRREQQRKRTEQLSRIEDDDIPFPMED